ncbi:MAG: peptidyl-prolyl cis-trans isomerase [Thermoanaerobaculia bacterium]|nr:peptidyl-prolyl cis-trans isomerase [Thermoanaerobaculia bacterium]
MLKVFRDNLKKLAWTLWLVIAAFILSLSMLGGGGPGPTDVLTAATVGDHEISVQAFRRRYEASERQARSIYGQSYSPEVAQQLGLAMRSLDGLIAETILVSEAEAMGLDATEDEIRRAILDVPGFQTETGGFIGQDQYAQILRANGYTVADFETEIRTQLLVDKLNRVLSDTTWVSDEEIVEAYREQVERARIRYVRVSPDRYRDSVVVADADLEEYFAAQREDFTIPEQRAVDYLLVEPALLAASLDLDEAELRAYYDANPDEFSREEQVRARHILITADGDEGVAAARTRIEEIKAQLAAGGDFAAIAAEVSEDDATRDRGGELGYFSRGRYNPALEEAAFSGAVGDLIGPVESDLITQTGLHLVEVLDRRQGGMQPFEEARGGIRARLMGERSQEAAEGLARELASRIASEGSAGGDGLRALAESEEAASFHSTEPFGPDDNVPGIGRGTAFSATAFALEPGAVSEAVRLPRGWAILHLREVRESRVPELEEVRDQVRQAVLDVEQRNAAEAALVAGLERVRAGLALEELAAELEAETAETAEFGRGGFVSELGAVEDVVERAFEMEAGTTAGPFETPQGPLVFELLERTEMDPAQLEQERQAIRERLTRQRLDSLLQSTIDERRQEMGVRYNQELLESLGVVDAPTATS